ncbi:MAG: right-handed parallel beta-helix repeat-containing protein [Myxococcota bacterium]|nr:right-handed parallel beta-helix repeat-containing protein [Myxococcota bacterium]
MLRLAALAGLLLSCKATTRAPAAAPTGFCLNPLMFGAVVDDGKDDRTAVQAAFDSAADLGTEVCLPRGELHVSRVFGKIPSLITPSTRGITIRGEGPASRIVMLDQPGDEDHRDWWVIQVSGEGHTLRDFAMDGAARGITDEQTHLIQLFGPARHITLERLTLSIPVQDSSRGGDCIRMLGATMDEPVAHVTISDVRGIQCARSFIAFQRHVSHVTVDNVTSIEVGGGAIDMEPTGEGSVSDVVVRRSTLRRGSIARGDQTVSLAGSPAVMAERIALEDCTIEGGVGVYRVRDGSIVKNRIEGGYEGRAMIKVQKDSKRIRIERNTIIRQRTTGAGIEITVHNGGWPTEVLIRGNEITMQSHGIPIHAEPVENIEIADNTINCGSDNPNDAVFLRGVEAPIRGAHVHHNRIRGGCTNALRVSQHRENVTGSVVVENNIVEGTQRGVVFENGDPSVQPVVNGNVFRGVAQRDHVHGSVRHGFAGKNAER